MHEKTRKIFFRIRAGKAEETQIWFSYSAQHLPITTHRTSWLWIRGRRGASVLIFLSQLSLSFSVLTWLKLTVALYCSTVQVYCVLCPRLSSPPPGHWLRLWHSQGSLHWPGLTLTLTLRQQHGAIIGETPANFQIKPTFKSSHTVGGVNIYSRRALTASSSRPSLAAKYLSRVKCNSACKPRA